MTGGEKRGLTIEEAATYCGVTPATYRDWVARGLVPGCWPGTRRIDRAALDRALDRLSGMATRRTSAFDEWISAMRSENSLYD